MYDRSEFFEIEKTINGEVRVSSLHNKAEKSDNVVIAKHFAEIHGEKIDLLGVFPYKPNPDAFNHTRNIYQEYKTNRTATFNAIDRELRDARKQADDVVLHIKSDVSDGILKRAIQSRVRRSKNIKEVIVLKNGIDTIYVREDITKDGFRL